MPLSADQFAKAVINAGLSSADEIKSIWAALPAGTHPKDGETFSMVLVEREKLTQFQATEILAGSATPLVLGDYVLLAKIGAGGMGQVFQAQHRHMKRLVAIKLLPTALTKDPEAVKRFQREVEAAAKLAHPNIVQAYDASVLRGVWYLVMEYVEGRDLSGVVANEGSLPIERAVEYIRQAAKGLAFAHENGVVHRDIKPANLLLDKKGTIKILDMGLARFEDGAAAANDGLTQTGQVMGTIDYMAPEQAFDTHAADARADIYSLGCTLYRLLTGANLFEADTLVKKLMAHQQQPAPDLSQRRADAPRELDAVFRKMVAKKPEDRYQTMAEVEAALAALLSGRAVSSPGVTPDAGSQLATFFRSSTSQGKQPQPAAATLVRPDAAATSPTSGDAATMALASPLQDTDPVSQRSVQIAREQTPQRAGVKKPPLWRQPLALAAGGLGGALLVLLGIWVIIRDKHGNEVARLKVPDGGKAETVEDHGEAKTKATNNGWHGRPADAPKPAIAPFDATPAKQQQEARANYLNVPIEYTNSLGMEFVKVPKGTGWLGGGDGKPGETKVEFQEDFYLGKYEVTQEEWEEVVGRTQSTFRRGNEAVKNIADADLKRFPVEQVSWEDCQLFIKTLNEKEKESGWVYRLPTEAEWEYACRGGPVDKLDIAFDFYFAKPTSTLLPEQANFAPVLGKGLQRTCKVGSYEANSLGLYDMHGNVHEWCDDAVTAANGASQHVYRGGSWFYDFEQCRAAYRRTYPSSSNFDGLGLRVARVPAGSENKE